LSVHNIKGEAAGTHLIISAGHSRSPRPAGYQTETQMTKREISSLQKKIRILKDWKIICIKDQKYSGQATILPSKRKAVIYKWGDSKEPKDYLLHELLHCAIRELLTRMNGKKIAGKIREAEETFVQDLCLLITTELSRRLRTLIQNEEAK